MTVHVVNRQHFRIVKLARARAIACRKLRGSRAAFPAVCYLWAHKTWIQGHAYSFLVDSTGFAPYHLPIFYQGSARIRR